METPKTFQQKKHRKQKPTNIYGFSKIINEQMSEYYSNLFKVPFIGLRFFTIWWRLGKTSDMFILKTLIGKDKKNI